MTELWIEHNGRRWRIRSRLSVEVLRIIVRSQFPGCSFV